MTVRPDARANATFVESRRNSPGRGTTWSKTTVVAVLALAAYAMLAAYVYRPDSARPFDMVDFSEFLSILQSHDSLASRFVGLTDYYRQQGRLNPIVHLFIAVKWSLFGNDTTAWQLVRAAQMVGLTAMTIALLRRLRLGLAGAVIGGGLMVVSAPAANACVRLTMAEPLATAMLMAATLIGTYYQGARRWRRLEWWIVTLAALTILAKEMLVAAVPLVLLVAWCVGPDGRFQRPGMSRRNKELFAVTAVVSTLILIPVGVVAMRAPAGAYVSAYGSVGAGPLDLLRIELLTLIPFVPLDNPMPPGLVAAELCYFGLIALGLKLYSLTGESRWHVRAIIGIGFGLPLLGAMVYVPWSVYQWFYSVPFLLGPSILLAAAVKGVEEMAPRWRLLAYVASACVLANMASASSHFARRAEASQFLIDAAADAVTNVTGIDSVLVGAREIPAQAWQGFGQTFARYAKATGREFPPTTDVSCADAARRIRGPMERRAVVLFSNHCPLNGSPTRVISRSFSWLDWGWMASRHDSITVGVFTSLSSLTSGHPHR